MQTLALYQNLSSAVSDWQAGAEAPVPVGWSGRCPREAPAPATLASLHEDAGRLVVRLSGVFLGEPVGMPLPFSLSILVFVLADVLTSMYARP